MANYDTEMAGAEMPAASDMGEGMAAAPTSGGETAQITCPHCGGAIDMSCSAAGGGEESGEGGASWEDDFRKEMSPRSGEADGAA